jgi:uncharacterized protein YheU (UPF0270 family)
MQSMLLQAKLAVLVKQVTSEELSLEDYVAKVKTRLERDKILAVYCSRNDMKKEAVQIMKRIKIMKAEILGVESQGEEEA